MKTQIQTILYNNTKESLFRSLDYIAATIENFRSKDKNIEVFVKYGDASSSPIFSEVEVEKIKTKYNASFFFSYCFFGFNSGTSLGHNILAKDLDADYLLIINPDIILAPEALWLMNSYMNDNVGMVEARQVPVEHHKEYDKVSFETLWGSSACALVKSEVFKAVGGYDSDTFFMYCDDVDLSWRIRLEGFMVKYCPCALAFHAKRFLNGNKWAPSKAEVYYSAEAAMLLAYKYSKNKLYKCLINSYLRSEDINCQEAANAVLLREKEGRLPKQIDKFHKVSFFKNGYYAKNRFIV